MVETYEIQFDGKAGRIFCPFHRAAIGGCGLVEKKSCAALFPVMPSCPLLKGEIRLVMGQDVNAGKNESGRVDDVPGQMTLL